MKLFNNIMLLFLFGFAVLTQYAEAQITQADPTNFSSRLVVSPYAQAVPNDSYTFIGVSHPSLDSALTQIGLVLEVVGMTTTVNNRAGRSAVFTVDAGETHRVFIANQTHSTINSSNTAFTDARTHIIPTADSAQFGSIRVTSVSKRPEQASTARHVTLQNGAKKYDDLSQVSIWGIVYTQSSGTGFAMEFIGDMHDSALGGEHTEAVPSRMNGSASIGGFNVGRSGGFNDQPRPGRGIN